MKKILWSANADGASNMQTTAYYKNLERVFHVGKQETQSKENIFHTLFKAYEIIDNKESQYI